MKEAAKYQFGIKMPQSYGYRVVLATICSVVHILGCDVHWESKMQIIMKGAAVDLPPLRHDIDIYPGGNDKI